MAASRPMRSRVPAASARRLRLARRLAYGLTPAEAAKLEEATEEEIHGLLSDGDFSGLVRTFRAVAELPDDLRAAHLVQSAWMELEHLIEMGDRGALLFVAYESNRGRHPAKALLERMEAAFARLKAGLAPREPSVPDPKRPPYESQVGMGQHPLGPAQAAARHLTDMVTLAAGRDLLCEQALSASVTGAPAAEAVAEAPSEGMPASEGMKVVWVPRHPGVPDLPDDPPLSPVAAFSRDNPAFAAWLIRRAEQRLAELGWQETADGRIERIPRKNAQGP